MGFKSTSTRRTSAASAVSSQAVVVNTGTGFTAVGSTVKANTAISLGVTTTGQTSASTVTTVSAGPIISNVAYLDANNTVTSANAVSTSGGNIRITGTGFVANSVVYINNTLATNTFVSSTQITAVCPAASAGNVAIMIFTPTDAGTQRANAIRYSGAPTWTTAAVALQNGIAANVSLIASSDSTLTYTLQDGSTLPTGISLNSAGYLTGTPTGYSGSTSVSAVIIATDAEGQAAQQTINISITSGDDQFKYTTLLLNGETSVTPFIKDASANNFGLTLAGDVRQDRFSPYYGNGYYSLYISTASSYLGFSQPALGNTFTIEMWVYPLAAGSSTYYYVGGSASGPLIGYNGTTFSVAHQGGWSISSSANPTLNTWNHIALVREGTGTNQFKLYLNGTLTGTGTDATTFGAQTSGTIGGSSSAQLGYISNFRIVNNQVLYTGNFTPSTTPLTASTVGASGANVAASISGTTLMMAAQSATFVDKSASPVTLTPSGAPLVSPAIPFAANAAYATYGSMYVPTAVTNYLALPHTASTTITSGSTDSFSAECWVYFNSATASTSIMDQSGANTVTFQNWSIGLDGSKQFQIIWGGTGSPGSQIGYISGTTVAQSGVWYHLAYVKTGAVWSLFVNGVRETTYSGLNTASDGTSNPLRIGSDTFSSQSINGYIADVRIYNGATASAPYSASSSTITIPTAPLAAVTNTQLLTCQYNGGANNSGIVDNGPFNAILTRNGNASQGTFSPFSPTGWSNLFNGSTDYFTVPATSTAFGSSSWTIECWFYLTSLSSPSVIVDTRNSAAGNNGVQMSVLADGSLYWFEGSASSIIVLGAGTITTNRWYHIAFVRSSTSTNGCALYIDGVSRGTGTSNLVHAGYTTYIGRNAAASQDFMKGYISNLRIVNGSAVYTGAFTPSASTLTAITNTSILTCHSNQFKDSSTNNSAITLAGTPKVQTFSPFSPSSAYDPALHGGSVYLDGTGDFLSMPGSNSTNIGISTASAFTVEAWIYPTVAKDTTVIGCAGSAWRIALTPSRTVSWVFNTSSSQTSTDVIKLNQWNHIAFTYDGLNVGTSNKIFVNGIVQAAQGQLIPSSNTAGVIYVGRNADSAAWDFQGYISGARIIRGYAAYTANFTLPTAPFTSPLTTPASLLLNFTNGGVVDAHSSNNVETVGNAQLSTAVKKYGNASIYFDGTGDYIDVPNDVSNQLSGAVYTIEMWLYPTVGGVERRIFNKNGASTYGWLLSISTTDTIQFRTDSTNLSGGALTAPVNQWTHVAVTHDGTTTRIFVNGQLSTSATGVTITNANELGVMRIGSRAYQTGSFNYTGYMDDIRITKGVARYTANFTPPTTGHLGL